MKKFFGCLLLLSLALVMAIGTAGCNGAESINPNTYAFVTIDINPSVEIITLGNNVVDVKAANYDACVLLEGEDFSDMDIEEVTEKIVYLADEMGYLTDTNNQVKITVVSDDARAVEILKEAAKSGAEKGSKKAETNTIPRIQDELTVKKLKEDKPEKYADISEEKVRLIESLMEHDSSVTYETGNEMTISELVEALKSALDEDKDIFTQELRNEYSLLYVEFKQEIEREIAKFYGNDYLNLWEKYTALQNIYNSIESRLEKSGLAEEHISEVMDLLAISDVTLIEKGGVVKPEYVLSYIDKHINKKRPETDEDAINGVIKIIEGYYTEKYNLTSDDINSISEVISDVECATLADVAQTISEWKNELEEIKHSVNLSAEQVEQIKVLKESFSTIKQNVLDEMSDLIAAARDEIAAVKQERGNAA